MTLEKPILFIRAVDLVVLHKPPLTSRECIPWRHSSHSSFDQSLISTPSFHPLRIKAFSPMNPTCLQQSFSSLRRNG